MTVPKDHKVTIVTRNGDTQTRMVTAAEARKLEDEPFRDAANVESVKVVAPPRR